MKKMFMLFTLILMGFTLTGCDFLNQVPIDDGDDFCLNNPDDPICLELITFDESDTVDELFTKLYDHFEINDDFCEMYIDSDNPLYDSCLESKNVLFPDDLNGYVVVKNTKAIEDNTEYQVVLENVSLQKRVIFTFELNIDDTILSISKWEYQVEDLLSEVGLKKVQLYQDFITDFYSHDITNEAFDLLYHFDTYLDKSKFYDLRTDMSNTL